MDFVVSLLLITLTSPLLLFIALLISIRTRKSPFFTQKRPGLNEKIFTLIKFKTMTDDTDAHGTLLPDHQRLTKIGRITRSLSIDELPQLFNVILGDMSLVGPRPLLVSYLARYNNFQKQRHRVKPGITGLAQVQGRNSISWDDKFNYDIFYIENIGFKLDFKIIMLTVFKVLLRDGISSKSSVTMEEFHGE